MQFNPGSMDIIRDPVGSSILKDPSPVMVVMYAAPLSWISQYFMSGSCLIFVTVPVTTMNFPLMIVDVGEAADMLCTSSVFRYISSTTSLVIYTAVRAARVIMIDRNIMSAFLCSFQMRSIPMLWLAISFTSCP